MKGLSTLSLVALLGVGDLSQAMDIVSYQSGRKVQKVELTDPKLNTTHKVEVINLNPSVNIWHLVVVHWHGEAAPETYHIENPRGTALQVEVDGNFPNGLTLVDGKSEPIKCGLWTDPVGSPLRQSTKDSQSYVPICKNKLFVRNQLMGRESAKERVADFLRRHIWGGEKITSFVKNTIYKDQFLIQTDVQMSVTPTADMGALKQRTAGPKQAELEPQFQKAYLTPQHLGLDLGDYTGKPLAVGEWYATAHNEGVFASLIEPKLVSEEILKSYPKFVKPLDETEASAVAYMVAFDLDKFQFGFSLGTKHPSLEWSERAREETIDPKRPGPDGFASEEPLVKTGGINPSDAQRVIATFTGGFKRSHAAFKWGEFAEKQDGSHYGFVENGVVFSRLIPGLATMIIYNNGDITMKTWSDADTKELTNIRHARQNGVPILAENDNGGTGVPHKFVGSWHLGNWSGSVDSKQRALRAGACIQDVGTKRYLLYGYFSSVTPNAMARVFQSYGCNYAIHLDMNALEHTYLALYSNQNNKFTIQHLIDGMNVLDREVKGQIVPRFLGAPDNRDFFYVMSKE